MNNPDTLGLIHDSLFRKDDTLTPKQTELLRRYEAAFTIWLDKPWMSDKEIRNFLMHKYCISSSQAYQDIKNLQFLFGKVRNASKEWYRYMANELVKEALSGLEIKDLDGEAISDAQESDLYILDRTYVRNKVMLATAKIAAAEALVKINRLNKIDADPFDWDQLKLPEFEPTNDPVEAGILTGTSRAELAAKIKKMEEKYSEVIEIKDVPYEPVSGD